MYRTPTYYLHKEFNQTVKPEDFANFIHKSMSFFNINLVKTE
jgi:hypothetical protein